MTGHDYYCRCTDGDPKHCHGWIGFQDESPCRCACHQPALDLDVQQVIAQRDELIEDRKRDAAGVELLVEECNEVRYYLARLRVAVEEICQQRATSPITRARLRCAAAGVDWRKVK